MANPWAKDRATVFYVGFALFGLLVVALGFSVTYVLPMARRAFSAPGSCTCTALPHWAGFCS